ncbi:hypothetical protein [Mycobacterium sp. 852002-10029_SCH5224772]|uniref:hypothetical protein n=1 Tax=Mycobacterium sp. 852002-10029_SCH5224772 TaxID=1834083 RepID=UPI000B31D113|nr:hypothetical protein [Mycobacterium sp. 852002-10029_SCH5224772]
MSEAAAVTSKVDAGNWLPSEHFAVVSAPLHLSILSNLPQPLRQNKTAGLVAWEGADVHGN